jgi:peroxiredoxin
MKRPVASLLLAATALAVAIALFLIAATPSARVLEATEARPAPAWTLPDVDGRPVHSADFAGRVMVVDFWATWCPPCVKEVPGYVDLQRRYGERGLTVIGISLDRQGPEVVREFMRRHGVNYPMVMGDDAVVAAFGGVQAIPTTFVVDRAGRIVFSKVGYMPASELERRLVELL